MTAERKLFSIHVHQGQDSLVIRDPRGSDALLHLDPPDPSLLAKPLIVEELSQDDFGRPRFRTDFPHLASNVMVVTASAADVLRPMLGPCGAFLPLSAGDRQLTLFHPHLITGLLDNAASDVVRFGDGRVMDIRRYRFTTNYPDCHVVRLAEIPQGPILVSEAFLDLARASGLVGPSVRAID